ncbi:MAG: hypothetical protein IPL49_12395 [Saprospirales bacterium]|nr:hypothetical protein [Saprospirales bacterium]MBK8491650.1 hypothetical protein [Saprospirales bacterium]
MKAAYFRPVPLIAAVLFVLHQLGQKVWGLSIPFADNYLDNLLCMPLLLPGFQVEQRWLWGREKHTLLDAFLVTALLSVVSEWVFPRISSGSTADRWDVVAYFAGTFIYLWQDMQPS